MILPRHRPELLALLLLVVTVSPSSAQDVDACDVPDGRAYDATYERLACRGRRALEDGRAKDAVRDLRAALAVPLHEFPNFEMLPLLAVAEHRAGDEEAAMATLERARLAFSVWTGLVQCGAEDGTDGVPLIHPDGRPVRSDQAEAAAAIMCGALYESYYDERTLDDVARDAALANAWLRARDEIAGR